MTQNEDIHKLASEALEIGVKNERAIAVLGTNVDSLAKSVADLVQIARSQGAAPYRIIAWATGAFLTIITVVVGAVFFVTSMQTQMTLAPVLANQRVSETEQQGIRDSAARNTGRIDRLESLIASLQTQEFLNCAEIEGQIRAVEALANSHFTETFRRIGDLYQKQNGVPITGNLALPTIANAEHCVPPGR